ncbi:uncharacterized protein HGUI_03866 [Hanseniaspora guilliermondii]|uniref:Uncharacterized protein n=1 Tax=Hanseniaspora guilliermondii TaxID=56406 RepID=A0A1L0CST3_9ASCO|nr:uncharacterized protein HGUI_03866 [Hanseniaspora guilliermondii]
MTEATTTSSGTIYTTYSTSTKTFIGTDLSTTIDTIYFVATPTIAHLTMTTTTVSDVAALTTYATSLFTSTDKNGEETIDTVVYVATPVPTTGHTTEIIVTTSGKALITYKTEYKTLIGDDKSTTIDTVYYIATPAPTTGERTQIFTTTSGSILQTFDTSTVTTVGADGSTTIDTMYFVATPAPTTTSISTFASTSTSASTEAAVFTTASNVGSISISTVSIKDGSSNLSFELSGKQYSGMLIVANAANGTRFDVSSVKIEGANGSALTLAENKSTAQQLYQILDNTETNLVEINFTEYLDRSVNVVNQLVEVYVPVVSSTKRSTAYQKVVVRLSSDPSTGSSVVSSNIVNTLPTYKEETNTESTSTSKTSSATSTSKTSANVIVKSKTLSAVTFTANSSSAITKASSGKSLSSISSTLSVAPTSHQSTSNGTITSISASHLSTGSKTTLINSVQSTLSNIQNTTLATSISLNSTVSGSKLYSTKTETTSELELVTCTETQCKTLSTHSKSSIYEVYTTAIASSSYSLYSDVSGNVITSTILTTSLQTITCTETKCIKPSTSSAGLTASITTSKAIHSNSAIVSLPSKPVTATSNLTEVATSLSKPSIVSTGTQEGIAANLKISKGFTMLFGVFFCLLF